jgi:hypothetical protein
MQYRGIPSWPPVWSLTRTGGAETRRGEIGILTHVVPNHALTNRCYLIIEYERERYMGCLLVDNISFCSLVGTLLQEHIGRSIKEIGDLDLGHTL